MRCPGFEPAPRGGSVATEGQIEREETPQANGGHFCRNRGSEHICLQAKNKKIHLAETESRLRFKLFEGNHVVERNGSQQLVSLQDSPGLRADLPLQCRDAQSKLAGIVPGVPPKSALRSSAESSRNRPEPPFDADF